MLFLVFCCFPMALRFRNRVWWWDWFACSHFAVCDGHMLFGGDAFLERSTIPSTWTRLAAWC